MADTPAQLRQLGFYTADQIRVQHRLVVSVSGLEKQGKTHFALTAPDPIVLFNFDVGLEGMIQKFREEKKIWVLDLDVPKHHEPAEREWNRFLKIYDLMWERTDVRTIIIDTATELWELLRMARFGKLTQVKPHHYGPVNAEFRELIRRAFVGKATNKNLILLHKRRPQYIDDKRTKDYERAGFSGTGYLVQINLMAERDEDGDFTLYIEDCRQNPGLADTTLTGDILTQFPALACEALPDTDWEDWT
jgi:hypothetical protein